MDVKSKVFLQLFNKSKLRNRTKTYLEQKFSLFIIKFKKLGFNTPLMCLLFVIMLLLQTSAKSHEDKI